MNTDARWNSQGPPLHLPVRRHAVVRLPSTRKTITCATAAQSSSSLPSTSCSSEDVYRLHVHPVPASPPSATTRSRVPLRQGPRQTRARAATSMVHQPSSSARSRRSPRARSRPARHRGARSRPRLHPGAHVDNPSVDQEACSGSSVNADPTSAPRSSTATGTPARPASGSTTTTTSPPCSRSATTSTRCSSTAPCPTLATCSPSASTGASTPTRSSAGRSSAEAQVRRRRARHTSGEPGETTASSSANPRSPCAATPDPEAEQEIVGVLDTVVEIARRKRRQGPQHPARRLAARARARPPLRRHAGIQPMRTYLKLARARHRGARSIAVSFGAPRCPAARPPSGPTRPRPSATCEPWPAAPPRRKRPACWRSAAAAQLRFGNSRFPALARPRGWHRREGRRPRPRRPDRPRRAPGRQGRSWR